MTISSTSPINTTIYNPKDSVNDDLMTNLSPEIIVYILSFLGIADLGHMACMSKRWKQIVEMDELWTTVARSLGIKISSKIPEPIKEQVRFHDLLTLYTAELIEALGGLEAFRKIPILDLGERKLSVCNMVVKSEEINAPIMRGVDGKTNKPFIIVRYKNQKKLHSPTEFELLIKINLRYNKQVSWQPAFINGNPFYQFIHNHLKIVSKHLEIKSQVFAKLPYTQRVDYISRLVKGQPCGLYNYTFRKELNLTKNGKSMVYLA